MVLRVGLGTVGLGRSRATNVMKESKMDSIRVTQEERQPGQILNYSEARQWRDWVSVWLERPQQEQNGAIVSGRFLQGRDCPHPGLGA